MTETRRCPTCGAALPAHSPEDLCPQCLLQAGLASQRGTQAPTAASPRATGFVPPTPAELARHFPQFEILELLGRGGMGAVYKARQPALDRLVAIKILPPETAGDPAFAERFTREARALAKLNHPNIVGIYDFGQTEGLCFFVMEFVDGTNLRQVLQTQALTPEAALAIVPQVCDALQYAHDEGIVHRDIKPDNILLDKKGRVKIADFGLVKLMAAEGQESPEAFVLTGTHQVMGTLRYMAPEQLAGSRQVDHRADIFSLGVVFYELLTGELPMGRFAPPSQKVQVDVRLDEIVLRALEQEPAKRYQRVGEVKTQVEVVTHGSVGSQRGTAAPATAHPLQQAVRFAMTPQPGYARWVGLPMLICTAFLLLVGVTIAVVVPPEQEAVHLTTLVGGLGLLLSAGLFFHLRWVVKGRTETGRPAALAGQGSSVAAVSPPAGGRLSANLAELAAVCVGLGILVPILLFMFTGDLALAKLTLTAGQALAMLLGLLSFRRHLGRYAMLLALVVYGAFSGVQIYVTHSQTPITYPWFGDTGFLASSEGPVLSDIKARQLGITLRQQKAADRIFQDYYRQYVRLERRHTKHTRTAEGRIRITITPFPDEMYDLAKQLTQELGGVVDQRGAPQLPAKGQLHTQLGLFRFAGEATVTAELWREQPGGDYCYKEEYEWLNGGKGSAGKSGLSVDVFPEPYRLFWTEAE